MSNQNGHKPAQLGNVTIKRLSDTEWALERDGERVASGLGFAQVTAIIRGELQIDGLQGAHNGTDNKGKLA